MAQLRGNAAKLRFEILQEVSRHPFHVVSRYCYYSCGKEPWRFQVCAEASRRIECRLLTSRIVSIRLNFHRHEGL